MAAAVHSKPPLLSDPPPQSDLNGNSAETMSSEDSQGPPQRGEVVLKPEETLTALSEAEKGEVLSRAKSEFNNRRRIVVRNLPNDITAQVKTSAHNSAFSSRLVNFKATTILKLPSDILHQRRNQSRPFLEGINVVKRQSQTREARAFFFQREKPSSHNAAFL
ncbi:Ribonucleoprotein PTB-binding 2 [Branchiostoma belcheri]|nr:Ribonucleoprotein PTB-binding 2 [Branchiostoma belcheri]